MSEKILLIDGHSILNRTFYGLPDLTNSSGQHTNAVYGFLNILFRLLDEEKPDYLAVAFDLHEPTFRHKMYEAYKGTRHPMPEELREQVPMMKEVLQAMGVAVLTLPGYEADDILGTIAKKSEAKGWEVTVLSGDRDLLQLATDRIMIRIPKTKAGQTQILDYHTQEVVEEFQLTPAQIIELKALMGDSSDNIPGIPGVGIKTATKILNAYGTIENAHAHIDEITPPKARNAMREHWDLAVLSKTLATINTDSPIELDTEAARVGDLFTPEAYTLFRQLEFKKLLPKFSKTEEKESGRLQVKICKGDAEAEEILSRAEKAQEAGVYLLASQDLAAGSATIRGLAVSLSLEDTWFIPAEGAMAGDALVQRTRELCSHLKQVSTYGLKELAEITGLPERENIDDIKIAAYLLDPLKSDYPFDTIGDAGITEKIIAAEEIFKGKKIPAVTAMETEQAALYAGETAYVALAARAGLLEKLTGQGMDRLYSQIEIPLVWVLADMEQAGIRILPEELAAYGRNLQEGIRRLEKQIYEKAGMEFNINSPKQLGEILFDRMKLPGAKRTKTGYSTSADILEKLAPEHPFVADILEYRTLSKLKSTYADGLAAFIGADGRIHSRFHQTITATGRISSADPNLQNIPVRIELGRQIRKVFVPEEGCLFVDADYSQIELRVLAAMSGDEKLISAYREAKDIHRITASQVFHVPFDEVTPIMRRNAKAVNFGIVYGISAFGLSQDLDISRQEAQAYIDSYYETYPGIRSFLDGLVADAKKEGYSVTLYGRRRPMPELGAGNFMTRQFGERVARNAPIQGTAADIIKIAMIRVRARLAAEQMKARLILQVHDELLIEAPEEEEARVRQILEEEMTGAASLAVRLEVDAHTGHTWYDAK